MKKALILFALILCCAATNAQGVVFFRGGYKKALKKAADENKLVFILIVGDQAPVCARIIRELETEEYLLQDYNSHFVSLVLDVGVPKEAELAQKYYVGTLPTWVWASADGQPLEITCNQIGTYNFNRIGEDVRNGVASEFIPTWKHYLEGERSQELIAQYLHLLYKINANADNVLREYRPAFMQGPQLLQRQEWELFKLFIKEPEAPEFLYLEAHLAEFKAAFGDADVLEVLRYTYMHASDNAAFAGDQEKLHAYTQRMQAYAEPELVWVRRLYELRAAILGTDVADFIQKNLAFIAVALPEKELDDYSFGAEWIARHAASAEPAHLQQALEWTDLVVEQSGGTKGHYERALVLRAMGQDTAARASMKKAIEMAEESGRVRSYLEKVMSTW